MMGVDILPCNLPLKSFLWTVYCCGTTAPVSELVVVAVAAALVAVVVVLVPLQLLVQRLVVLAEELVTPGFHCVSAGSSCGYEMMIHVCP